MDAMRGGYMLKEENKLREFLQKEIMIYDSEWGPAVNEVKKLITALVRACYENAAKICEEGSSPAKITNAGAFYAEIIRRRK